MTIRGIPTTVMVAPAPFSSELTAAVVVAAIARGFERERTPVDLCPLDDREPLDAQLQRLDFDRRMRDARALIVGARRLDQHGLVGTPLAELATRARQAGVPCYAVVGECHLDRFGRRILDLQAVLEADTERRLRDAGERLAQAIRGESEGVLISL